MGDDERPRPAGEGPAAQTGAPGPRLRRREHQTTRCGRSSMGEPGLAPTGEQVPPAIAAASYGRERWYVSPEQRRREAERMRGRADETPPRSYRPASILFQPDPCELVHT